MNKELFNKAISLALEHIANEDAWYNTGVSIGDLPISSDFWELLYDVVFKDLNLNQRNNICDWLFATHNKEEIEQLYNEIYHD